jgi:hypothetical protein
MDVMDVEAQGVEAPISTFEHFLNMFEIFLI